MSIPAIAGPQLGGLTLRQAWTIARPSTRSNSIVPIIIVVAIAVLLALAITVVAAAIITCAAHGAVFDAVANLSAWKVKIHCHRL